MLVRAALSFDELTSSDGGEFSAPGLAPGQYLLSASLGTEASALVGPLILGPGQEVGGVTLELVQGATLTGTVYDALTRESIASARVASSSGKTVTDRAGRFRLEGLPAGQTWVETSAPGHVARTEWLTIRSATEQGGMEVFLQPAALLRGRLLRRGQPVAGGRVWGEPALLSSTGVFGPVESGPDGRYELTVEGGRVRLAASAGGARVEGPTVTVGEGVTREALDIELGEGLVLTGFVRLDGRPVAGAGLMVFDARTSREVGGAWSDSGGKFVLDGLSPGAYLVQVQSGKLFAEDGPYSLESSDQEPWRVDLQSGKRLYGRVEPAAAGVFVRWRASESVANAGAQAVTGADGRFEFEPVPEGPLWVQAEGAAGLARVRTQAGTEVVLHLVPGVLRGAVETSEGHAVTDFTVVVNPAGGGPRENFPVLSPTGEFSFRLAPGDWEVTARSLAYGEVVEPVRAVLVAGKPEAFVRLVLVGGREVDGRVVDAKTGRPIAGAELVFNRMPPNAQGWGGRWATLVTDGEGRFRMAALPRDGSLWVQKEGYQRRWLPLAPMNSPARERTFDIALTPGPPGPGPEPYEGVGMSLDFRGGQVAVSSVFEGSPAEAAGLRAGDRVEAVDGAPVAGRPQQEVLSRIMGPAGTVVRIAVVRGAEPLVFLVRRRSIQL